MPLTRDKIVGHDTERLAFKFTLLNEEKVVPCQISDAAMDELGGTTGTENSARQAQFVSLRDDIEGIASDLFAQSPRVDGYVIRIFTKHVKQWASAAAARKAEEAEVTPPPVRPDPTAVGPDHPPEAPLDEPTSEVVPDEAAKVAPDKPAKTVTDEPTTEVAPDKPAEAATDEPTTEVASDKPAEVAPDDPPSDEAIAGRGRDPAA
jgi:uncharacterized protein DUF1488